MSADYIMLGGFLGAGKTTAMLRLAGHLSARGRRVGLITNDQSYGLVDTSLVAAKGYPVEEITGGCFCCRFNSLTDAADRLTRDARPDVFLAEPVGSCTDLRASVQYPLSRLYGDDYRVAPLSVLVDPVRAARVLGLEAGGNFSEKVLYVYGKQLEEADFIVVNKIDLLTAEQRDALTGALQQRYPDAEVLTVSARAGDGLDGWFEKVTSTPLPSRRAMEVDYDIYADGEALLGWLNATAAVVGDEPFDGNAFLDRLAGAVHARLAAEGIEIAHLKMTMTPESGTDLAVINLTRGDGRAESSHRLAEPMSEGELIINLRAEGDPEVLRAAVLSSLAEVSGGAAVSADVSHCEHFRPGRPQPTHRMAAL